MYSPFSLSAKQEFISHELSRKYLAFPTEIEEAYSAMVDWLSTLEGMSQFDHSRSFNLDSQELLDTARQFSVILPAHTMKVYQNLLRIEDRAISQGSIGILDQPYISIVDNGCGGGTASVALMILLLNYQKYRLRKRLPLFPIELCCLGIDPNTEALQIYGRFLQECAPRIRPFLIDVQDTRNRTFPGTLPENLASILKSLTTQDRTHLTVVALANIIRPLHKKHEEETKWRDIFERIGIGNLLPERLGRDIGAQEISALREILNTGSTDQIIVLLIGAHSTRNDKPDQSWREEMAAFQEALRSTLSPHQLEIDLIRPRKLKIVNPRNGYWRKREGYTKSLEKEYDSGYAVINSQDYIGDTNWHEVLEEDNLLLAWARVRNALKFEMLEDTIELRLFEANIRERLSKLRHDVLSYQWNMLSVEEMLHFRVPKGPRSTLRPMSVCRLEDQILSTAMLQTKAREYENAQSSRSYAHKLSNDKGEFLYQGWYEAYEKFLNDARQAAQDKPSYQVIETDLSSYYTNIIQSKLTQQIEHQMLLYNSRCENLIEKLVRRDCGIEKTGCGIPQGHIVSGAIANLYLKKIDHLFGPDNRWGIEYFRFVDDMVFIFPPSVERNFILDKLDTELAKLGLTRSREKTSHQPMSTQEFLELRAPDDLLNELDKEHNFLLSDLYKLNRTYIQIALDDWWAFVELYQKLLFSIRVYISVPRLSRKLQKNLRWWRRTFNWWHKLKMPQIEQLEDLKDTKRWQSEFNQYNSDSKNGWIQRRSGLVQKLLTLFRNSVELLDSKSEVEQGRARTRVRFASNRLGQLGFGEEAKTIVDLIVEQPWTLHVRRICQYLALQGRQSLLVDGFDRIVRNEGREWTYVRGVILKALSDLPSVSEDTVSLLACVVLNGKTVLERTMASETLILLRKADWLDEDDLIEVIERTGDGYLSKNLAFLHALAPIEDRALAVDPSQHRILNETIEYCRVAPELDEIFRYEPDVLREEFYVGSYPDDPDEFEGFRFY